MNNADQIVKLAKQNLREIDRDIADLNKQRKRYEAVLAIKRALPEWASQSEGTINNALAKLSREGKLNRSGPIGHRRYSLAAVVDRYPQHPMPTEDGQA